MAIDCIFINVSKAFDVVPRDLLVSKLHAYKVDDKVCKCVREYFSFRKQYVIINGFQSQMVDVTQENGIIDLNKKTPKMKSVISK